MRLAILLLLAACERDTGVIVQDKPPAPVGPNKPRPDPIRDPIPIDRPKTRVSDDVVSTIRIAISTTAIFVNGDKALDYIPSMDANAIAKELGKKLRKPDQPGTRVIIAADQEAQYKVVVGVLDAAKTAGYGAIAFETTPP